MSEPIYSEMISFHDLIGLVSARMLNRCPELSGPAMVIEVSMISGKWIRIDVLGVAADA